MNLYQKLLELKKAVPYMKRADAAYGYTYVGEDDLLSVVNAKMNELGLLLVPSIVPGTLKDGKHAYKTSKGADALDIVVTADMTYEWIDVESGEKLMVPWVMAGQQDDASQAIGSGITYCGRYFLLKFLQIATGKDDPDFWRSEQKKLLDKTAGATKPAGNAPAKSVDGTRAASAPDTAPATPAKAETPPVATWSEADIRTYKFVGVPDGKGGTRDYEAGAAIAAGPKGTEWLLKMAGNQKRTQTDRDVATKAAALCEGA